MEHYQTQSLREWQAVQLKGELWNVIQNAAKDISADEISKLTSSMVLTLSTER